MSYHSITSFYCIFVPIKKDIEKTAMIKLIGTNAGLVWRALSKAGRMSVKELKKETKLRTDKELFAAIGWLAKEEKLESEEKDSEIYFWLS